MGVGFTIQANARIDDRQKHMRTWARAGVVPRIAVIYLDISSFKGESSPFRHRISGVGCQIQKDLSEFRAIRIDLSRLRIEIPHHLDVFPTHGPQHLRDICNDVIGTHDSRRTDLTAAKSEHLPGQLLRSLSGTSNLAKPCVNLVART